MRPLYASVLVLTAGRCRYAEFIDHNTEGTEGKMSTTDFSDLLNGANYMAVQPLLNLCCAKLASVMQGKTVEEIRTMFGIVNDFTPEEEQKIREENKEWLQYAGEPDANTTA